MKGSVVISIELLSMVDDADLVIKSEIGKQLRIQPVTNHKIQPYVKKMVSDGLMEFKYDTELTHKLGLMERRKNYDNWKRKLEEDGWEVLVNK